MSSGYNAESEARGKLQAARRIVIKLGTSTVTDAAGGVCTQRVQPIVDGISQLMEAGRQVMLVSSGAVGLGRSLLGLHPSRLKDMAVKQACAAAGQSLLMESYKRLFDARGRKIAQILLTEEDFSNWGRYSNLRRTIEKLLGFGVLPIVNENDTVSTAELESVDGGRQAAFSDNDRLAALVMSGMEADALVLLTNVDGFMRGRGGQMQAELEPFVERVTSEIRAAAGPSRGAQIGRGGMKTKIEAAEIAMNCGGVALIANGSNPAILAERVCRRAHRDRVCACRANARQTTVAGLRGRSARASGGGCGRAAGNHRRQSEFAEFGRGTSGARIWFDGRGEHPRS